MKHVVIAVAAVAAAVGLSQLPRVYAQQKAHKIAICHGTASAKNPYVMIIVGESALSGHLDGTGPGHGKNNSPDFVLGRVRNKDEEQAFRKAGDSACAAKPDNGS